MANLHVQPKRKNNAWIWIVILVLIIAAAIYYFEVYKKQTPVNVNVFQPNNSMKLNNAQATLQPAARVAIKSC